MVFLCTCTLCKVLCLACTVGKMQENGAGGSKKDAKREAAQKMIDKLKSLGQNRTEQVKKP